MLIDLTHTLNSKVLPYPSDPFFTQVQIASVERDGFSAYKISTGLHLGTHVDGMGHFVDKVDPIGTFDLNSFYGDGVVLNCVGEEMIHIKDNWLDLDVSNKIVLIYTGFDALWGSDAYFMQHPQLTDNLVDWLIDSKVKMVGIDFPSPDVMPYPLHKKLLQNGVFILENLTNIVALLPFSNFKVAAFPLKLETDSSLVRAVAIV